MPRNQWAFLTAVIVLSLMVVSSPAAVVWAAASAAESVDGGSGGFQAIVQRYSAFAPLLIGIVVIALRRKFFPGKHD
ncbi:MAG: hypothetical protein LLG09_09245 [Negativicutes bacterium]|nr:hypothetical protein [Negativicutes bacterium]